MEVTHREQTRRLRSMAAKPGGLRILVVLGKKPARGQSCHPHFERNLRRAVEIARDGSHDLLLLSGGPTRRGFPPEAEIGRRLIEAECPIPIVLELDARTTSENVRLVRDLLAGVPLARITIVTSPYHVRRTRVLFGRLWPAVTPRLQLVSGHDAAAPIEWLVNWMYLAFAYVDPSERTMVRFTRRWLRNG